MPSLFIENHAHGLAFYINGDLQFDTADEAIYHEYLVVPAIALTRQRFPDQPLRILVCGGGDGLAVRDILRFPQVSEVTIVDYDPDVVELGRTAFAPYNLGSLLDQPNAALGENRVTVHTREAFEFVSALPDLCYHAVICDFTFPTSSDATRVYSLEWFQQLQRILYANGVIATNGVSPERNTTGFWCLYQTILAAKLYAKPMKVKIPSFDRHDYGDWGFFLGSESPILKSELEMITLPAHLQGMLSDWRSTFRFSNSIASDRHSVNIHTLDYPQLFYYLLNPESQANEPLEAANLIDFIDIQEAGSKLIRMQNPLQLESLIQVWIERSRQFEKSKQNALQINQLLPVQHHSHQSEMTKEWFGHLKLLLEEVDLKILVSRLVDRAQELPPQLASELKQLKEKICTGQPIVSSNQMSELIVILSVTLLMASLAAPDAVFAKGSSYGSSGSSSGSSNNCEYDSDGSYTCSDGSFPTFGFSFLMIGGSWLWSLLLKPEE